MPNQATANRKIPSGRVRTSPAKAMPAPHQEPRCSPRIDRVTPTISSNPKSVVARPLVLLTA